MRIKHLNADFQVEERITLPASEHGAYSYYRVEKEGQPTTAVRNMMAARLKVTPSALDFPALKDASAQAVQYASVRKFGPAEITGKGFVARRVACGRRALRPADLQGNAFNITARDLSAADARRVATLLSELIDQGMPNYFDDQRFGSYSEQGFIGKALLARDAEKAVRLYLAEPMIGDPANVREFKALVQTHWGQWGFLLPLAPRPSNYRSVITYLKDHPQEYRKAANLIQERLLSIYLSAYQSWLWNHILAEWLRRTLPGGDTVPIIGVAFPLPPANANLNQWRAADIPLPRLTASYEGEWAAVTQTILQQEGLTLRDLKARLLQRTYLSKGERTAFFVPENLTLTDPQPDAHFAGRWAIGVRFALPPGCYASLVLKILAARLGVPLTSR